VSAAAVRPPPPAGEPDISLQSWRAMCHLALLSGMADLPDVEMLRKPSVMSQVALTAGTGLDVLGKTAHELRVNIALIVTRGAPGGIRWVSVTYGGSYGAALRSDRRCDTRFVPWSDRRRGVRSGSV